MTGKKPIGDWLGVATKAFLPEIEALGTLLGGRLWAIELIIYLGEHSYTNMFRNYTSGGEGIPACPMDITADNLFLKFID
jgi:hypothetical protein